MLAQPKAHPRWLAQFILFTAVGAIGTVAHYALLVILVELSGVKAVTASTAGALLGALVNYLLNRRFTFKSGKRHAEALTKFFIIAALGLVLNTFFMLVFIEMFGLYYILAQVLSTGLVLVWNFVGNRYWTFRDAR